MCQKLEILFGCRKKRHAWILLFLNLKQNNNSHLVLVTDCRNESCIYPNKYRKFLSQIMLCILVSTILYTKK